VIVVQLEDRIGQVRFDAEDGQVLVEWDGVVYAFSPERTYTIAMALMKLRARVRAAAKTSPSPTS
jgi:hypothetical protein